MPCFTPLETQELEAMTNEQWEAMKATLGTAKPRPGFDAWMAKVEAEVQKRCGLSTSDLDDFLYDDEYEDGATPVQAAKAALRNAGGDF